MTGADRAERPPEMSGAAPGTGRRRLRVPAQRTRRVLFGTLVVGTTALASLMMVGIVGAAGVTGLEVLILALFVPTFAWITVSFWNAVFGFVLSMARRDPLSLTRLPARHARPAPSHDSIRARTALVMPAHNEDPELVMGGLAAILRSLEGTGHADRFDLHLLSDTTDPRLAIREEAAWRSMRARAPHPDRLYYRRRARNTGRKAGNIAEFCHRCVDEYEYVVVLDADSVMSGETLVELVRTMEANPDTGLLQTVPIPARQRTVFGRFVQFAAALYSPMLAMGQSFWQGDAANYWGHNAILRLRPFVDHCALPVLPGRPPLGGPILSHDFVEAALLRRAGWKVYLLPTLGGSWEGVPGNVLDFATRDRRWAQGSIQHLRLLGTPGLHPVSRLHFTLGAMGYLSSVLWLLILLAGTAYVLAPPLSARTILPLVPGTAGGAVAELARALGNRAPLLALTAGILFLPKLLGLGLAALRSRRSFGGAPRLLVGGLLEAGFAVLIAPLMMLYHTRFVGEILTGRDVPWDAQERDGRKVGRSEALKRTVGPMAIGVAWAGGTLALAPAFLPWLSPILAGILFAAPIVRWTSLGGDGPGSHGPGILATPAEVECPPELGLDGRRKGWSHMFLASLDTADPVPSAAGMYEAERGLFDLQRGRPVLVTPREGSGDVRPALVAAVEGLTPETLSRLRALGRGPLRLVVTRHRADAMGLPTSDLPGVHAGVSLRLNGESPDEILRLASTNARFDARGLDARVARPVEHGGLALTRLARMLPAVLAVESDRESAPELADDLASGVILQVGAHRIEDLAGTDDTRIEVTFVSEAPVPLEEAENVRFMLFREANGLTEHVAILIGDRPNWPDPVPVRLHSACLTGDLFGSLRCDCGEQLRRSLQVFARVGGGILLYLEQEGRGIGLGNKLRAYSLQQEGLDTVDADCVLGFGADERRYHGAVGILRHLGVDRVRLLTNNPEKLQALEDGGISVVDRTPLHGTLNRHNLPYVRAKVQRAGHWLGDMLQGKPSPD